LARAPVGPLPRGTGAVLCRGVRGGGRPRGIVAWQEPPLGGPPPYLRYELVSGGDLGKVIRSWHKEGSPPPVSESLTMMRHLARIVAFAHGKGIVHRDLKPANILLQLAPDGRVAPRIADFGIGGIISQQTWERAKLAGGGRFLTTAVRGAFSFLYASPEQKAGGDPDPRDDVYALGIIWYQTLTGDLASELPADWQERLSERGLSAPALEVLKLCLVRSAKRLPDS